jgi:hypothetical protein
MLIAFILWRKSRVSSVLLTNPVKIAHLARIIHEASAAAAFPMISFIGRTEQFRPNA